MPTCPIPMSSVKGRLAVEMAGKIQSGLRPGKREERRDGVALQKLDKCPYNNVSRIKCGRDYFHSEFDTFLGKILRAKL